MGLRLRFTADAVAAVLLLGAAGALVGTPYDGDACRNVASAYALPAAQVPAADPPAEPTGLTAARAAVSVADSDLHALGDERAAAEKAKAAAEQARNVADDARSATWETSPTALPTVTEFDVDMAESRVASAESWLQLVQEPSEYSPWSEQDVADAQDDLDTARAELASTEQDVAAARSEQVAREAAAEAEAQEVERLEAAADAAEGAAQEAAAALATAKDDAESRLATAQSRVQDLETSHEVAYAEWSHEQRLERDAVVALNNVRDSCRENGAWRAAMALVDVGLLAALGLRAVRPRTARLRLPSWRRR